MSAYASVTSVGGLLPTSLLERVRAGDAKIPGTSPESYGLVPGERIGDHVTRSWNRLRGVWESFTKQLALLPESDRATTLTRERWCRPMLDELGFAGLQAASGLSVDGKAYPISHKWGDTVPVHVMGARLTIDRRAAGVAGAAAMSPHGLVQEYLNRSDDHLWGIVTNGLVLRVLRDNASLTKQAFVEFDLEAMFAGDLFSDFVVLWLVCHRTRFEGQPAEKCLLEQWSNEAAESGTRALDKLRDGVEAAITALGSGFVAHPSNSEIRDRLRSGDMTTTTLQHEVLRVVYRLLFLLVAESRDLLHAPGTDPTAITRYKQFYSVDRLRTLAAQRRGSSHDDLWTGLTVTMHGLWHDGVPGLGLSPLGSSLWAPDSIASVVDARIDNRHLLDAIRALCYVRDDEARSDRAVDYKNLGAEELGSIYESLLELHVEVDVAARTFALTTAAGNERKTTGSYYTPTSLISELLDSALDPVLDEAVGEPDPEVALLDLKVIDCAAGSGHFLIAAAHRIAGRLASVRAGGGEPAPDELRHALRDVVSNCIHAIDVNPMAVELCKVSMWLEATEPGKPLSFLDHRIVCGNALLGATPDLLADGIPDDAFAVLTGDDKATVSSLKKRNKAARKGQQSLFGGGDVPLAALAETAGDVSALHEESIDAVEAKARRWDEFISSAEYANALFAANLWCAAFVVPKTPGALEITDESYRRAVDAPERVSAELRELVDSTARDFAFLHWHLAFLDAFGLKGDGGFDVVLGNPPWEKVKLSEKEFFAARDPEIAEMAGAKRKTAIAQLAEDDPTLFAGYQRESRVADGVSHFIRKSGRFPLCGRGDVNTYAVFAELMRDGTSPTGRTGVIVPTGIATDDTTKFFFADCVDDKRLVSLFDFENAAPIFPGVHRSYKFCLLTLSGLKRPVDEAEFVFFAHRTGDLQDPERRFMLSAEDFLLLNPTTRTCPVFRSARDAEITKAAYRRAGGTIGSLTTEGGLPAISYVRLVDYGDHVALLHDSREAGSLPVYEAKMVHAFDHRFATFESDAMRYLTLPEKQDPAETVRPSTWLSRDEYRKILGAREYTPTAHLVFREVARSTDERTLISCLLPPLPAYRKLPVLNVRPPVDRYRLLGCLNSYALDYLARQKHAALSISLAVFWQLPLPAGVLGTIAWLPEMFLEDRAAELVHTSWDLPRSDGSVFRWIPERRELMRAELDAAFFHLYGLDRDEVDYIMDTFPIVRRKDETANGEYRTKRLILERYDAMAETEANGTEYETILDPPPADPSIAHDPSTRPDWADWYLTGGTT